MKNLFVQKKIGNAGLSVRFVLVLAVNDAGHLLAGVLGSNTGGVFRSLNNGDIWEAVNAGLTRLRVQALGFDRQGRGESSFSSRHTQDRFRAEWPGRWRVFLSYRNQ